MSTLTCQANFPDLLYVPAVLSWLSNSSCFVGLVPSQFLSLSHILTILSSLFIL